MKETAVTVDSNFVVKGLGLTGPAQPNDTNRAVFSSEATLNTAIAGVHKAADLPHLTMNDKVFAARYGIAALSPSPTVFGQEEEPEPEPQDEPSEYGKTSGEEVAW